MLGASFWERETPYFILASLTVEAHYLLRLAEILLYLPAILKLSPVSETLDTSVTYPSILSEFLVFVLKNLDLSKSVF